MTSKADRIQRMLDRGKSWTDIAAAVDLTVPQAKEAVRAARAARRALLAHTPGNERLRGLLEPCTHCTHPRKAHADKTGQCTLCGPEREEWKVDTWDEATETWSVTWHTERPFTKDIDSRWAWKTWRGCDAFLERPQPDPEAATRAERRRKILGIDKPGSPWLPLWFGRQWRNRAGGPQMPMPSDKARRRRARKAGKGLT